MDGSGVRRFTSPILVIKKRHYMADENLAELSFEEALMQLEKIVQEHIIIMKYKNQKVCAFQMEPLH